MISLRKIIFVIILFISSFTNAKTRIKDIASIQGVRDNFIQGYGLVTGLNGTGDNLQNSLYTRQEFKSFLSKFNINIDNNLLKSKNIASVVVTAILPSFCQIGKKIDIKVSAIGDASSLFGGVLLPVQLIGADGNTYAIAQGSIIVPNFSPISPNRTNRISNVSTNGWIESGAIVETNLDFKINSANNIKIVLNYQDFTTAVSVAKAINDNIASNIASPLDSSTILVNIPNFRKKNVIKLISEIESTPVETDFKAKIIINEATGTIVMGNFVKIKPIAVSHGNMMVNISDKKAFVNQEQMTDKKYKKELNTVRGTNLQELNENTCLSDLVNGLNKFCLQPRDLIDIIRSIKAAGALNATVEIR